MEETTLKIMRSLPDTHLVLFAMRLRDWLIADLNESEDPVPEFTESRAKALLRAANVIDDPTLHSFARLIGSDTAVRLALADLLNESGLSADEEVSALAVTSAAGSVPLVEESPTPPGWLSLFAAGFAAKSGFPLYQLDPASPPGEYSPAGQLVKRAAFFVRQQVQRSATDRDKLGRQLAYRAGQGAAGTPSMDQMASSDNVAPLPPHYRPPIPVNYPEVARETLQVNPESETDTALPAQRGDPISIAAEEVPGSQAPPLPENVTRMPAIRITEEQLGPEPRPQPPARPRSTVVTPRPTTAPAPNFSENVRQIFGRGREPLKSTKLRVVVEQYPDGPGMYGLQIKVSCRGVKSYVAGTTNRDGKFLCELPVRLQSGLTYDVDVTWPRDMGGDTERKSVTLNADRTEFVLPFYRTLQQDKT